MSILALRRLRAWFLLLGIAALGACGGGDPAPAGPSETPLQLAPPRVGGTYVRPPGAARLLGMNIGAKNYDDPAYQAQLARLDVVILGFYRGWHGDTDGSTIRRAVRAMKALNPALKVGQYTKLNEAQDSPLGTSDHDLSVELDATGWWLRNAAGQRLQWTSAYAAWDINITGWTAPDAAGDRWPQWLARRDNALYFQRVPEFDVWYFDNVMANSRVPAANWKLDGVDRPSNAPDIAAAYRSGHLAEWQAASAAAPGRLQMGNVSTDLSQPEFDHRLGAAFLEAQIGRSWSIETWAGWLPMMQRYFDVTRHLAAPALVGFNVSGSPSDYRLFRYAFTSCLLGDGYFSFTDPAAGYSSVPWFDEYEVALGAPMSRPSLDEWSNGVHRRRFQNALVLVNPQSGPRTVTVGGGWRRLLGTQDPVTNDGRPVRTLTLPAKDGIVLVRR